MREGGALIRTKAAETNPGPALEKWKTQDPGVGLNMYLLVLPLPLHYDLVLVT